MTNFSARGQAVESACKAYAYRAPIQASVKAEKLLRVALLDIESFPVGSEEWKAAVKRNLAVFK